MVKVSGPMFSLDASGSIAGALVASKWKGRNYMRSLVKPANPKSGKQVGVRAMFKFLSQEWDGLDAAHKAEFDDRGAATAISPFNAYVAYSQERWRRDKAPSQHDPASEAAYDGNVGFTSAVGGVRMATITITTSGVHNNWGVCIARSATTGFTPGLSNTIAVINCHTAGANVHIDTPLAAGTYYYRIRVFSEDGTWEDGWQAEKSATVTDV